MSKAGIAIKLNQDRYMITRLGNLVSNRDCLLRIEESADPTSTEAYDPEGLRSALHQGAEGALMQYDAGHRNV